MPHKISSQKYCHTWILIQSLYACHWHYHCAHDYENKLMLLLEFSTLTFRAHILVSKLFSFILHYFSSSHIFFHVLTKPPPCIFTIIRKMLCITCSVQKKVYLYWVLIEKYYVGTVLTEIYLECSKHATNSCKGYAVRHV